jgi:serine/threonine protein phosphatase PrpC
VVHTQNLQESNQIVIHSANVGDARAVLCHQGQVTRLSQDHRPDDPAEAQRIEKSGGFVFQNRVLGILAVTRSLGDHCMKDFVIAQPYYSQTTIERANMIEGSQHDNTVLILACDGLWDVFKDDEAVDFALRFPGEKTNVAQALAEAAVHRGSTDNITVVVVWL